MQISDNKKNKINKIKIKLVCILIWIFPYLALAEENPVTKASNKMKYILFGALGTSVCAIIIGATFLLAKTGKVSWDRFVFIGMCTAGFLGTPSIIALIQSWVGGA